MCSLMMRIIADGFILNSSSMGAPGVDEINWQRPLRPGVRLRVRATVLESRASGSRPTVGLTKFKFELLDEADAVIMTQVNTMMYGRRTPGGPA
jgi:acyl dehydratase